MIVSRRYRYGLKNAISTYTMFQRRSSNSKIEPSLMRTVDPNQIDSSDDDDTDMVTGYAAADMKVVEHHEDDDDKSIDDDFAVNSNMDTSPVKTTGFKLSNSQTSSGSMEILSTPVRGSRTSGSSPQETPSPDGKNTKNHSNSQRGTSYRLSHSSRRSSSTSKPPLHSASDDDESDDGGMLAVVQRTKQRTMGERQASATKLKGRRTSFLTALRGNLMLRSTAMVMEDPRKSSGNGPLTTHIQTKEHLSEQDDEEDEEEGEMKGEGQEIMLKENQLRPNIDDVAFDDEDDEDDDTDSGHGRDGERRSRKKSDVPKDRQQQAVTFSKVLVMSVLLVCALVAGILSFVFLQKADQKSFRDNVSIYYVGLCLQACSELTRFTFHTVRNLRPADYSW